MSTNGRVIEFAAAVVAAVCLVIGCQARGSLDLDDNRPHGAPLLFDVADYRVSEPSDSAAITAAIAAAADAGGGTVYFPAGTYLLDESFELRSGVNLLGQVDPPAILQPKSFSESAPEGTEIEIAIDRWGGNSEPVLDVTISNIHFRNIRFTIWGDGSFADVSNIYFRACQFSDGEISGVACEQDADCPDEKKCIEETGRCEGEMWLNPYIEIALTTAITVDRCVFLRSGESFAGRGVKVLTSKHVTVKDSYLGTTRDLAPASEHGWFRTAVNVSTTARSSAVNQDPLLDGLVVRRHSPFASQADCGSRCDHGFYAYSSENLRIVNNRLDRDPSASLADFAIKITNLDRAYVRGNGLSGWGLGLRNDVRQPPLLAHVDISANRFAEADSGFHKNAPSNAEHSIAVRANHFLDGSGFSISNGTPSAFCFEDNEGLGSAPPGTGTGGCEPTPEWSQPLPGAYRGHYNDDGVEDFVVLVGGGGSGSGLRWRAHLSGDDGYLLQYWDWDPETNFSSATGAIGGHVADFDGDGDDELAYWGLCGADNQACWAVHGADGKSLATGSDWGGGLYPSEYTAQYGVIAGDFTGDGRADLLYPGYCYTYGNHCWRAHVSTENGFVIQNWGTSFYPSSETRDFGLMVGQLDDTESGLDVFYRGSCYSYNSHCWRVHRSAGSGFHDAENWGNSVYYSWTGETQHFGMQTGDINGDGLTDVGYVGRCGSSRRWRYHTSTGSSFFVSTCSLSNLFPETP